MIRRKDKIILLCFLLIPAAKADTQQSSENNLKLGELRAGIWKDTNDANIRELTVFNPEPQGKGFGGIVSNWTSHENERHASRVSFSVPPELMFQPSVAVSKLTTKDAATHSGAIRVERSFSLPSGTSVQLTQDFGVVKTDGRNVRQQKIFSVNKGAVSGFAELQDKNQHRLAVAMGKKSGTLELPSGAGTILGFELDPQSGRLTVQTSKAVSYSYDVKPSGGDLEFDPVGQAPIKGGLTSFEAKIDAYDCGGPSQPNEGDRSPHPEGEGQVK